MTPFWANCIAQLSVTCVQMLAVFHFPCPRHPQLRTTTRTDPFCLASAAPALQLNVISTQTKTFDLLVRDVFVSRSVTAWQTVMVEFDVMAVDGTMKIVMGLVDYGRQASVCVRLGETCLSRALTAMEASCFIVVRRTISKRLAARSSQSRAHSITAPVTSSRCVSQRWTFALGSCGCTRTKRARMCCALAKSPCSLMKLEGSAFGRYSPNTATFFRQDKLTDPMHLRSEFLPEHLWSFSFPLGANLASFFRFTECLRVLCHKNMDT